MSSGKAFGTKAPASFGLSWFVRDDGGYTTVATACALLVSLSLVFACLSLAWVQARAAEVQRVADAGALAGENVVASYTTVAKVLDASVLSLGICGLVVGGAGLILCAVPGMGSTGLSTLERAHNILEQRRTFSQNCAQGLERLEATLPWVIALNSASTISANTKGESNYAGVALPFPAESQTNFDLDDGFDLHEVNEVGEQLSAESDKVAEQQEKADKARHDGWFADCGNKPYCLWQRAGSLSNVPSALNPYIATEESWNFGIPLERARAYYTQRLNDEAPSTSSTEELTRSASRKAFYTYARMLTQASSYYEFSDGRVSIDLRRLPKNTEEVKGTSLYTDPIWPLSQGDARPRLHSSRDCPNFGQSSLGTGALSGIDSGKYETCPQCNMTVTDLGRVPAASTAIENGFEYHWSAICDAAERFESAQNELAAAQDALQDLADEASGSFETALAALKVSRPQLCPPGAYGCIAFCARSSEQAEPSQLVAAFLTDKSLPSGAAISGAVLAPESTSEANSLIANLFDGMIGEASSESSGFLSQRIVELWGSSLEAYGAGYGAVQDATEGFFQGLSDFGLGSVADFLREQISALVHTLGLEPADIRPVKPVLTHTQNILSESGYADAGEARRLLEALPTTGTPAEMVQAMGRWVKNEYGEETITIAELPIPGTDISIPLTLRVDQLLEVLMLWVATSFLQLVTQLDKCM